MNKDIESYMNEYEKIQHQINSYERQINYLRMLLDQKNEALEEQSKKRSIRRTNRVF